MSVREIIQLGDPRLYQKAEEVSHEKLPVLRRVVADMHDTMMDFRLTYGFGRAIAAPQIGVAKRLIYMFIDQPVVLINPILFDLSKDMMTVWDNCMSFPHLQVKVKRHKTGRITFRDLKFNEISWNLEGDLSELLQHECDHLDGILAVQRAIDPKSFAVRTPKAPR
ncbi:MAG: peptide deformylase [Candidatus Zixiibacteriota bacterium]